MYAPSPVAACLATLEQRRSHALSGATHRQSAHGSCSCPRAERQLARARMLLALAGAAVQRRTLRRGLAGWLKKSHTHDSGCVQNSFGLTSRRWWELTFSHWCGPSQARRSDAHKTKSGPREASTLGSVVRGRSRRPSNERGVQSRQKFVLQFPYCDWRQKD
jgi:hypothetical protein